MIRAFTNAHLLDPAQGFDGQGTMLVADDKIMAIGPRVSVPKRAKIIDCDGLLLMPGLIDMQVFIGEPGNSHRETLASASYAAAAGGITRFVIMPNLKPAIDDAALVDFILRRARDTALVRVHPMAAITRDCAGETLTEFALLQEAGALAFTDGDKAVMSALTMQRALDYATNFDALIVQHAMDSEFAEAGVMNQGALATRLGLAGIPSVAETIIIERDLRLVEQSGARYHIAQISCAESVDIIRRAKARGLSISCGVSANHLLLTEENVANYRSFAKLNPPLRREADRAALIEGLIDDTIDVLVSAHNPQDADAKRQPFAHAAYGSVGVETLLATLTTLARMENIPLLKLVAKVTQNPAAILRLDTATLKPDMIADFTLVAPDSTWIVDSTLLRSKSRNSAIDGHKLYGQICACYVNGQPIFTQDEIFC